jgi:hypothetical protein
LIHEKETRMANHPTTYQGEPADIGQIGWDDHASIHRREGGGGVLFAMKALYSGTLAEMVALIRNMPAGERGEYVIQKAGDRQFGPDEIMALAARTDFPG